MKGGYYISQSKLVVTIALCIVIVVTVGLLAGLVGKKTCPDEGQGQGGKSATSTASLAPSTTPGEPGPWDNPFLPQNLQPVHYELWLYPDFYYNGTTYTGQVNITINVTSETSYLIVHMKMMEMTKTQVFTVENVELTVKRSFEFVENQYWVVETDRTMPSGSTVFLRLEFSSSLVNGIVGFYKSTYFNTDIGKDR